MNRLFVTLLSAMTGTALMVAGCGQSAPAAVPAATPVPAKAAATAPTKAVAAAPTAAPAAAPTKAPAAAPAKAADWPEKGRTMTFIIPYAAGGGNDVAARIVGPGMEKELGIVWQVVNKPGAGAQLGMTELFRAAPDGYTLGMAPFPVPQTIPLDPTRKSEFKGRQDFTLLAMQAVDPAVFLVRSDSPYQTLKDLLDAAKAKPRTIKIAATGKFAGTHLSILQMEHLTGAKFAIVQFDGGAPSMTALLGGHVDAVSTFVSSAGATFKSGQSRVLGILDNRESPFLPGVKTAESQGYKAHMAVSRGHVGPKGIPGDRTQMLVDAYRKTMLDPAHEKQLADMTISQRYMGPEEFAKYWDEVDEQVKPLMAMADQP